MSKLNNTRSFAKGIIRLWTIQVSLRVVLLLLCCLIFVARAGSLASLGPTSLSEFRAQAAGLFAAWIVVELVLFKVTERLEPSLLGAATQDDLEDVLRFLRVILVTQNGMTIRKKVERWLVRSTRILEKGIESHTALSSKQQKLLATVLLNYPVAGVSTSRAALHFLDAGFGALAVGKVDEGTMALVRQLVKRSKWTDVVRNKTGRNAQSLLDGKPLEPFLSTSPGS